jgi:hypothetical protein
MARTTHRIEKLEKSKEEKGDFMKGIREYYRNLQIVYGGGVDEKFPIPEYKSREEFIRDFMDIADEIYRGKKRKK